MPPRSGPRLAPSPDAPPASRARRVAGLAAALLGFGLTASTGLGFAPGGSPAAYALATTVLLVILWSTAAVPLWVSALAPLGIFPLAGVFEGAPLARVASAGAPYVDAYVVVFLGGMAIAAGLEETGLSRRVAAAILRRAGASPLRILVGLFAASAAVSMWISNTAAATLLLPVALALLAEVEPRTGHRARFGAALILAVAWGANVGGIGTRVGTPTNMQLSAFLEARGHATTFLEFSAIGLGFVLLFAPCALALLWLHARRDAPPHATLVGVVDEVVGVSGPWSAGERAVAFLFGATASAWIAAAPIAALLAEHWPALGARTKHVEAGAALCACAALLVVRPRGVALVSWSAVRRLPWSALLLIGGSFALAAGIEASGLDAAIRPLFEDLGRLPGGLQLLAVTSITVIVSAFASNTATIAILLPLLAAAFAGPNEPVILFAAGIASSCDFALPAGTPPNAIAFASGRVPFAVMLRAGIALDVVAALVAAIWCRFAVPLVLS